MDGGSYASPRLGQVPSTTRVAIGPGSRWSSRRRP